MRFVELTSQTDGRIILVNPDHVEMIEDGDQSTDDLSMLHLYSGRMLVVRGRKKDVATRLEALDPVANSPAAPASS